MITQRRVRNKYILNTNHIDIDLENKSGVYKISNSINDMIYVGSTENLMQRYKGYCSKLKCTSFSVNAKFLKFTKNHGNECFSFEVIEYVHDNMQLLNREKHWIDTLKPFNERGFNIISMPTAAKTRIRNTSIPK